MAGLGKNVGTSFSLRARMNGSVPLSTGSVRSWFFTDYTGMGMRGSGFLGDRQLPSAHIEPIEGKRISVAFWNQSMMEHTIHLHGLDVDQANDGVPSTSFAIRPMARHTYSFVAPHAGTYHYHCHVDTVLHYEMGMHGAVIVRPPDGSTNRAWNGGPSFDEEVLWQLSTIDPAWHGLTRSGPGTARHRPKAFLLNGRETTAARNDPYSRVVFRRGQKAYLRIINAGYQWARVDLGGLGFEIVASDGRPMRKVLSASSLELGPGERYDVLIRGTQAGTWNATQHFLDDYSGKALGSCGTVVQIT